MLVLTRRMGESIEIGPHIKITLLDCGRGGSGIRIGIDAPKDVLILRSELSNRGDVPPSKRPR